MKFFLLVLGLLCLAQGRPSFAGDETAIQACLNHWGKQPFGKGAHFRTLGANVKVLGIGGNIADEASTAKPELVLVKANVNVLSKSELRLMNPNGWYCLKGKVAVLGKTVIKLHCKANLAMSNDGATVMGGSDAQGGVTVLGTTRVERVGCASGETSD